MLDSVRCLPSPPKAWPDPLPLPACLPTGKQWPSLDEHGQAFMMVLLCCPVLPSRTRSGRVQLSGFDAIVYLSQLQAAQVRRILSRRMMLYASGRRV